ncbi:MAG TPA: general stress protein, partial [Gemmatimonadales bacterium]|nr:general stress protein [Gemmatimonadales bacterium]
MKDHKKTDAATTGTKTSGTVVGLFKNQVDAEKAIRRLKDAGFSDSQIGVAMRDRGQQQELIEGTGTQAAEGAATGAISGGVLGGVIGLLAGVGALAIPGVGPIIAGGALASTLAGAGIGAAAGGLLGALMGMGIPEEDARYF